MTRFALAVVAVLGGANWALADESVDFAHDVLPILRDRCATCHTGDARKGGLSMDTRAGLIKSEAVVPGKSDESELIYRVTSEDRLERMPPKGDPLTHNEIAVLRTWIEQGASWDEGVSIAGQAGKVSIKPRRPELPPSDHAHPIDRILDPYFAKHEVTAGPGISDAAFLRRISLDVTGLLPTAEQLDAFAADATADRRERVINRLLGDRRAYADHWLTFWNDLLRNDYQGTGYIDGGRRQITAWLYQSLSENKPYDQFVRELIHPTDQSDGFIRGIKWRGNVNASQSPELQFAQNTSQVFLGVNMKCASCHDSFVDDWKLADAYGLAAITAERPLEMYRCDKPTGVTAVAKFPFPSLGEVDPAGSRDQRLEQFAKLLTDAENGRLTRTVVNRLWQRLMGRGIVHPVDVMSNEPWNADLLDYLAVHLADNGYDLKKTIELIVTSRAYQSQCAATIDGQDERQFVFHGPAARRMTAEQFVDAVWMLTGTAPAKPDAKVIFPDGSPVSIRASLVNADGLLRSLGRPNREQVVTTRPGELTTLQALELTNGRVLNDLVNRGAKNLRQQHPERSGEATIAWLYRNALSRSPTPDELATAQVLLGEPISEEGLADLLWAVFMLPEFQMIR